MARRPWAEADVDIGRVRVLVGDRGGAYPSGNSLLVRGAEETAIIDPSLAVIPRQRELTGTDRVINSHCHEDHIAGNHCFPDASWHLHQADRIGMRSLDDFMAIYGYPEPIEAVWRVAVVERFHFLARADVLAFADGDVFDLGGVRIRVIHTPGHTRGHCAFHIEPEDVLYLGDIDLSGFGPYYGDAWSDLEEFERTLDWIGRVQARHYATFHHIGVLEREAFLERLTRFRDVIRERERRLLEYLEEPRSLDDIVRHRFVYRPADQVSFADGVELRSMSQHLERLVNSGRARQLEPGCWRAVAG